MNQISGVNIQPAVSKFCHLFQHYYVHCLIFLNCELPDVKVRVVLYHMSAILALDPIIRDKLHTIKAVLKMRVFVVISNL